jgi:hypothetical protein
VSIPSDSDTGRSGPAAALKPARGLVGAAQGTDPIALYAAAIDTSDFVARVAPLIHQSVRDIGDLLDIGAGGGQLRRALRAPNCRWTAIEPSSNMRARLANLKDPPHLIAEGWETTDVPFGGHDTVLAANIAAPLQEPNAFLQRCGAWARH